MAPMMRLPGDEQEVVVCEEGPSAMTLNNVVAMAKATTLFNVMADGPIPGDGGRTREREVIKLHVRYIL